MTARFLAKCAGSNADDDSMEFMDTLEDDGPSPETIVADGQEAKVRHRYLKEAAKGLSVERHISSNGG